ncbi:PREDICTED: uncharacterized protein LOC104612445 [Nelumbo nucifera]|uniref:RING-type domain-containing protein n=2 Tax=Nelumbo nucifera TaxID=4432 RepID=A0A822YWJ5_NELNU|nr:PREDICTED: uncharacterized protein LOC104612445 [Nelumbo nucifera]DAD33598.1 TPA_asm: hypothetical protein HUJ06_012449 [Nelumbo nucifera]
MNQSESSSSADPINPCPICLGLVKQEAYLDRCFHRFCYNCISQWATFVATQHSHSQSTLKCPICKSDNSSIIYGCDGDSFQRHYINHDLGNRFSLSEAHKYRLRCYYSESGAICKKFDVLQYWKRQRYLQPNKWLQSWLRREFQVLTQEEDVDIIVHHIHGLVESFMRRKEKERSKSTPEQNQQEFKTAVSDAARPFFTERTERFVNEIELFLASGLNIEAYDKVYLECLGLNAPDATSKGAEVHEQTQQVLYFHLFDEDSDNGD